MPEQNRFESAFVWHARLCRRPARVLAEALGCAYGRDLPNPTPEGLVIRYGKSGSPSMDNQLAIVNGADNVRLAAHKYEALQAMFEAGVNVPVFDASHVALNMPLIGRPFHHFGGRGMKLYMQQADVARLGPSDYYTEYIPKRKELRVHIFYGKSIRMSEKRFDETRRDKYDPLRWNHKYGMSFGRPTDLTSEMRSAVRRIAKKAVHSLGLDFGAVDVVIGEDNQLTVLEVNTAPSLKAPSTLNAYVRAFHRELREF